MGGVDRHVGAHGWVGGWGAHGWGRTAWLPSTTRRGCPIPSATKRLAEPAGRRRRAAAAAAGGARRGRTVDVAHALLLPPDVLQLQVDGVHHLLQAPHLRLRRGAPRRRGRECAWHTAHGGCAKPCVGHAPPAPRPPHWSLQPGIAHAVTNSTNQKEKGCPSWPRPSLAPAPQWQTNLLQLKRAPGCRSGCLA